MSRPFDLSLQGVVMSNRIRIRVFALLAAAAAVCWGQSTGRITGTVLDPTGAAVPNATVTLQLPGATNDLASTVTSPEGTFTITALNAGTYSLSVDAKGFTKAQINGVAVDPGRATDVPP